MATMVKEKNRKKKKSKNRNGIHHNDNTEESLHPNLSTDSEPHMCVCECDHTENSSNTISELEIKDEKKLPVRSYIEEEELYKLKNMNLSENLHSHSPSDTHEDKNNIPSYPELNSELSTCSEPLPVPSESVIVNSEDVIPKNHEVKNDLINTITVESHFRDISPSAPMMNTQIDIPEIAQEQPMEEPSITTKIIRYLPIEEAKKIFHIKGIVDLREISAKLENIVEVKTYVDLQHPIRDLISNFRSSLASVEKERVRISNGYKEEQKARSELWNVQKQTLNVSEKCPCGANVDVKVVYEQAEFQKEKLAAAQLRLDSLLRDVVESYCCYQHEAMLAYCEIEDIMSLIVKRSKESIRYNLAYVLNTLNATDDCGEVFTHVMQDWAVTLGAALFDDQPDLEDLLFFVHLLFRQSRSVRWAEHVVNAQVDDVKSAARFVAFLEILLIPPGLEATVEGSSDVQVGEETWEELYPSGVGGAVGKGRLRERDLLAILKALPLRDLIASIMLLTKEEMEGNYGNVWTGSLAFAMVTSISGVRVLLDLLGRALPLYRGYRSVHALLRQLGLTALQALEALHLQSRQLYPVYAAESMMSELEGCFVAGYQCLPEDRHKLPTHILSDKATAEYCQAFISGIHEKEPREIERLNLTVRTDSCAECVRIVVHVAAQKDWRVLSKPVLHFLFKTGIQRPAEVCAGGCGETARELLPHLLIAEPELHTTALLKLADLNEVEIVDPAIVECLAPAEWRPTAAEVREVLLCWSTKCPGLLQPLLERIDCRPHKGIELEAQWTIGVWLCTYTSARSETVEWAWSILRRLCLHRARWGLSLDSFSPAPTDTLFELAYALLASEWGHSLPLVCSKGVGALQRLASARPADAVHCLDDVMRVLAQSPESVSLTPEFTDIFGTILSAGPGLVRRALGRGGLSGQEMLQRLILEHVNDMSLSPSGRRSLLSAWLHALWKPTLPPASRVLLETAMRACRDWQTLDAHVTYMLEEMGSQVVRDAVAQASVSPLLTAAVLRAAHSVETHTGLHTRLLPALVLQRHRGERVHVDKALKQIDAKITSEELVIHRAAASVLAAPLQNPSHLTLWCLFFNVYLQRPPENTVGGTPAAGPLFFSGIMKTIILNQLKKRLQDTALYHRNAAAGMKSDTIEVTAVEEKPDENIMTDIAEDIFPRLTLKDLRGDDEEYFEIAYDSDDEQCVNEKPAAGKESTEDKERLISYHKAAEKMILVFERWLGEGESVQALPYQADIARFLADRDINAAWKASYEWSLNKLPPEAPSTIPTGKDHPPTLTYYDQMIQAINTFKYKPNRRRRIGSFMQIPATIDFSDEHSVIVHVERFLTGIEKLVLGWSSEAERARALDSQLWQAVSRLRVQRPLPPVRQPCPKGCKPLVINLQREEWCLSTAAARDIEENRRSALLALRRLTQPKAPAARVTAGLIAISRRITDKSTALRVLETLYCSLHEEKAPAHRSLMHFISYLAEEWVCSDALASTRLLERWSRAGAYALCSAVVRPARERVSEWRIMYLALLRVRLPPTAAFSYLSRFEIAYWATKADDKERRQIVFALLDAVRGWANKTEVEYQMLIELAGLHSSKMCCVKDVLRHVVDCCRGAAPPVAALPPGYLAHLALLVITHQTRLRFEELTLVMEELGRVWGEARGTGSPDRTVACAPHVCALLRALGRAYAVAAAKECAFPPDFAGNNAWACTRVAWAPWVEPHAVPLLPLIADDDVTPRYTTALDRFVDTLQQLIEDMPVCAVYLLRHLWLWAVEACLAAKDKEQQCRAQAVALLAQLRRLPWHLQWFSSGIMHYLLKLSSQDVDEVNAWCSHTLSSIRAETWLNGVEESYVNFFLPMLFQIFVSNKMQLPTQSLDEACRLPWHVLTAQETDHLLTSYYERYYNIPLPYHELPYFKLIMVISQLSEERVEHPASMEKRCIAMAFWVRAAIVPSQLPHLRGFTQRLLDVMQQLALSLGNQEHHLLQLLSCAIVTLCIESAATETMPLWQRWVRSCGPRLRRVCVSAAATLGNVDVAAPLVDTLAQQILADPDAQGWCDVAAHLCTALWAEPALMVQRGCYRAAYALLFARQPPPNNVRCIVSALASFPVIFNENEVVLSLWICALCRIVDKYSRPALPPAEEPSTAQVREQPSADQMDVARDVRSLLIKWAELKRSIYQMVTLQHSAVPTQRHRLLCYLGLCILTPPQSSNAEASFKNYEAACQSANLLDINPGEIVQWGREQNAQSLPRLAVMLFPQHEIYFRDEVKMTRAS